MWKNKLSKLVKSPGNQTPFYAISSEAKLPLAMGWKLNTKSKFSQMLDEIANFDLLSWSNEFNNLAENDFQSFSIE